ncbi:16S rRNA (cytosine(1402)-N(4))-methyltransferase [bacterium]|nr:16S rRNA (cytosine(1402)-N(4))-methyltransferase [bacterium]|tara:strand:- start:20047 stop:20940 length:894 start_codon:yes stop_codon:yes gene_type:complete
MNHVPVLLKEVIEGLALQPGDTVVDATTGGGGHGKVIAEAIGKGGTLISLDADKEALIYAEKTLKDMQCHLCFQNINFRNLEKALQACNISKINKIIFDLGWSTLQLEHSKRGFSFLKNEPLVMTFQNKPNKGVLTAHTIVNTWDMKHIETIIKAYGEERFARAIANAIVKEREKSPIQYSDELGRIVKDAIPSRFYRRSIHPATKTFQALRIAVNDEIGALEDGLEKGFQSLKKDGRMAVISFHSLEDRTVKRFIKSKVKIRELVPITKKPIIPSEEEITHNPRSRSAKLRIAQKI